MKKIAMILLGVSIAAQAGKTEETVVQYLEDGQFSLAQAEVKKAAPKGQDLIRMEAFLYHGAGMADSALVYLRQAYESTPKDPRISLRLAEVLVWKKDFAHARALVDAVSVREVEKDPRPWEPGTRRANIYLYLQELQQAQEGFQAVAADPRTPANWAVTLRVYRAQIAAWQKDFPRSILLADSVLKSAPGQIQASLIKGEVLEWEGKYSDARSTYTSALQKHPDDWQLRQRLEKLSWVK
jgi:tetratricopeptide (TPR) repeat protein